ncbi:response regulator [Arcobacter peruensis]|uniref:response regulator n=1 Tax=Arcobacter peruensis TaxID=2320140 RepID=UPI000F07AE9F|nr:response regulator [Arcobacter peruensis]
MKIPVMIIEDEMIVAMEIADYLENLGYEVVNISNNSLDGYNNALKYEPHIIMMDIRIKGDKDGIDTASMIQKKINTSIIYLTAYCDETTVERAIKTNPSAYLTKPFNKQELFVSLKMAVSSYDNNIKREDHKVGDILFDNEFSYDSKNNQLIYNNEYLHLTKREIQLLNLLVISKNCIVSIYEMENKIWPDKFPNENTRRALVSRLRAKMKYKFIETIPSIGYRINI